MRLPPRSSPHDRTIARLAVPALGALVAEPLYILADTAVVGHLGTPQLGGLAVASTILLTGFSIFIFLAYGTTATVARLLGAGQQQDAARQAIQGLWIAVVFGVLIAAVVYPLSPALAELFTDSENVRTNAVVYLRISLAGLPAALIMLAGVGYLRGGQDTRRPLYVALGTALFNLVFEAVLIYGLGFGIGASALSTVVAQWIGALIFIRWIAASARSLGVGFGPDRAAIGQLGRAGLHLLVRTAALRGATLLGTAVAGHISADALAAHQIAFNLWMLLALVLDAIAIAGQALVAQALGRADTTTSRQVSVRMIELSTALGVILGILLIALSPLLARFFSSDPAVRGLAAFLLLWIAALQPISGAVFALDGILIGAGDQRYLARAMAAAFAVFLPLIVAVDALDYGIGWVWAATAVFMAARLWGLAARFAGDEWAVTGASRAANR